MWYWEFNAGSYYTTCFEVEITGDAGGDDDGDDDDDDSSDDSGGSTSFDDYIIQIPISYFGALYDEDTLTTGANNIVLDDDSISYSFVVVGDASVETGNLMYVKCQMFLFFFLFVYFFFFCKYVYFFFFFCKYVFFVFRKWNATIQTNTNSPGTIFNEAYDYTSNPEGDSQLCDEIAEAFGSGSCTVEPGKIIIYGESSSGNHFYGDVNQLLFGVLTFVILFLIQ